MLKWINISIAHLSYLLPTKRSKYLTLKSQQIIYAQPWEAMEIIAVLIMTYVIFSAISWCVIKNHEKIPYQLQPFRQSQKRMLNYVKKSVFFLMKVSCVISMVLQCLSIMLHISKQGTCILKWWNDRDIVLDSSRRHSRKIRDT